MVSLLLALDQTVVDPLVGRTIVGRSSSVRFGQWVSDGPRDSGTVPRAQIPYWSFPIDSRLSDEIVEFSAWPY
jgi:hypothetical protein